MPKSIGFFVSVSSILFVAACSGPSEITSMQTASSVGGSAPAVGGAGGHGASHEGGKAGGGSHQGGSAGSSEGGSGGSAGSSEGGSTGGNGGSPQGGSGGAAPVEFSCKGIQSKRFVLVGRMDPWPPACWAGDCSMDYPDGSGFQDLGWGKCFVEKVQDDATVVRADLGPAPKGTRFEVNPGMSADCSFDGGDHAVDQNAWLCSNQSCSVDVICCYGESEVGRIEGGKVSGKFGFGPNGNNFVCVTE